MRNSLSALSVLLDQLDPDPGIAGNATHTFAWGFNYCLKGDDLKFVADYIEGHVQGSVNDGSRLLPRLQTVC